jgi:hypothetical protein
MAPLPGDTVVVRGGQNLPESFAMGSGVTVDSGLTPEQASDLFRPTVKNPSRIS